MSNFEILSFYYDSIVCFVQICYALCTLIIDKICFYFLIIYEIVTGVSYQADDISFIP